MCSAGSIKHGQYGRPKDSCNPTSRVSLYAPQRLNRVGTGISRMCWRHSGAEDRYETQKVYRYPNTNTSALFVVCRVIQSKNVVGWTAGPKCIRPKKSMPLHPNKGCCAHPQRKRTGAVTEKEKDEVIPEALLHLSTAPQSSVEVHTNKPQKTARETTCYCFHRTAVATVCGIPVYLPLVSSSLWSPARSTAVRPGQPHYPGFA